jgi:Outer membrane protein beta-barrel domain
MEHIDNDMDDLFKKAGELYPLKISGSDWDGVAAKFQDKTTDDANAGAGTGAGGAGSRRRWRLLALLIPLILAGLVYTNHILNQKNKTAPAVDKNSNAVKSPELAKPGTKLDEPVNQQAGSNGNKDISGNGPVPSSGNPETILRDNEDNEGNKAVGRPNKNQYAGTGKTPGANIAAEPNSGAIRENQTGQANTDKPAAAGVSTATNSTASPAPAPFAASASATATASTEAAAVSDQNKTSKTADTSKAVAANNTGPAKKTDSKKKSPRGIYAGVVLGPDWSTVHMQSVNQLGYSVGITAGYRFNERLAIETGLLWDRKYYYSKGEYFDKKNINVPYYWNISSVNGNCNMWEIPLAVRYDFASRSNHSFFAKAGFSSYIMTKQNYSFGLDSGNVQRTTRYIPYDNVLSYFFSIVQVSAGYEHSIGRNTFIRVEPYVKIPLQGVGTGSMPISSLGIYFGITHSFR